MLRENPWETVPGKQYVAGLESEPAPAALPAVLQRSCSTSPVCREGTQRQSSVELEGPLFWVARISGAQPRL